MIGEYLKQVNVNFILDQDWSQEECTDFIEDLVKEIDLTITMIKFNDLPPSFDALVGLKESHMYIGWWQEVRFVTLFISSCKDFSESNLIGFIRDKLKIDGVVELKTVNNTSIKEKIKDLKNV